MLVTQNLLDGLYIHTVLQHKGGGRMAQLVGGVFCAIQTGIGQVFFYKIMDRGAADTLAVAGDKQRILILAAHHWPYLQIAV